MIDRITARFPPVIVAAIERHVENEGYPNRSEYLRELVRDDLPDGLLADIRNERTGQNAPRQWRSH